MKHKSRHRERASDHDSRGGGHPPSHRSLPGRTRQVGLARAALVLAWWVLADAALLFAIMARYASLARRVDQTAAVLAVPEVAWTAFATVLSTAVAAKNG